MTGEPVTELRRCEWPIVYGYLRLHAPNQARRDSLHTVLSTYCVHHELRLATVFSDHDATLDSRDAGFVGLLDVLELDGTYGVVIPSRGHLGRARVAPERIAEIARTKTRLMVVRERHNLTTRAAQQRPRTRPVR